MSYEDWLVIVPAAAADFIAKAGEWGKITCRVSGPHRVAVVLAMSNEDSERVRIPEMARHFMNVADWTPTGHWYKAPPDIAEAAYLRTIQRVPLTYEQFKEGVPLARRPLGDGWELALTFTEGPPALPSGTRLPSWSAWALTAEVAQPIPLEIDDGSGHMTAIANTWPTEELANRRVLLLGAGSIGGAAAESLAAYSVGSIDIVDPDRLLFHNLPRHILSQRDVGRTKVSALKDEIESNWPDTSVEAFDVDLVGRADLMRPLIDRADIVVCTVDGVEPRRVAGYLATRATKPIVFACVLEDGRFGEVLRIRPMHEVGCLDCQRRRLRETGNLDPEPSLDLGYGMGTRHNPMTAVGGDLRLVGALAAKSAVATLLAGNGDQEQLLADDNMTIGLRPSPGYAPPFDIRRALDVRFRPASSPYPDCPACMSR